MRTVCVVLSLCSFLAAPAIAAPNIDANENTDSWSIGAGMGVQAPAIHLTFISQNNRLYASDNGRVEPWALATLERRLGAATWILLSLQGAHSRIDAEDGSTTNAFGALGLGIRRHLWSVGDARLSGYASLGAHFSRLENGDSGDSDYFNRRGGNVSVGATVDYELAEGLDLRLSTPLVVASHSRMKTTFSYDEVSAVKLRETAAQVTLSPSLELRVHF